MVFPYNAIAGKDRVLYQTYESYPDNQELAASYYGSNAGVHGYVGGINYVYFSATGLGEITWMLKNIFSTFYGGVALSDGVFDFDISLGSISGFFAEVVTPAPLVTPVGNIVFSIGMTGITLNYFSGGVIAALPANATVHFCISFFRNLSSIPDGEGLAVDV